MGLHDRWYENAIIYCLDVETFMDSDGDGVGDFAGLTQRLDYLNGLGVSCLWLMPFYPSPNRDDGYDVTDYFTVDPRFGNLGDFVEFVQEARERGMRVITDLIPNHTSDQHPWFQAARKDKRSKYRDYYVWRDDKPSDTSGQVVFPGEQDGIWTYDDEAEAYYLHHFYDFQPDVDITNAAVRDEIRKVIGLWLQLGVSGFRIDAVPFLINLTGVPGEPGIESPHLYLEEMRDFLQLRQGNGVFLGEVDVGLSTIANYFGGGNQLQLLFNFIVNRYLFLSLAKETADPLKLGLTELPEIPGSGQWVNFLRHHDEANLSRLTDEQRQDIFQVFAPEPEMQIYGRGMRRRLAPMLGGDQRRLRLAYSLLFSLPGAPMLFYGEEIGMGENLEAPGRLAVRTPMQWSDEANAGFSTASAESIVRPMQAEGPFGYHEINVAAQRGDPDSLLNWMARLIRTRRECPEFGWGRYCPIDCPEPSVFMQRCDHGGTSVITIHNLAGRDVEVSLDFDAQKVDHLYDLFSDTPYEPLNRNVPAFTLRAYGYRWLRLGAMHG